MNATTSQSPSQPRFYPWLILALSAAFLFYKYVMQVSPSVMTNDLMAAFHLHGIGLGNLAATFFYAYVITQLFVGVALDRFSPRVLTALAIGASACGALLFGFTQSLFTACLARALMGMGAAFATISYMKLSANWFRANQFALLGGLLATAAMVGAIFGQAPLALVVEKMGWRESLRLIGWIGIGLAVLYYALVRNHPTLPLVSHPTLPRITKTDIKSVLKNKQNWLLTFYCALTFSPVTVLGGLWGNPFLETSYHLAKTQAASLVSLIFFGLAVGGPIFGFLSDHWDTRKFFLWTGTLLALISCSLIVFGQHWSLFTLGVLLFSFGFGIGAFMIAYAIAKEINTALLTATAIGMLNSGDAIIGAFTEPLIGKFLDLSHNTVLVNGVRVFSSHDFHVAFVALPLYLIIACCLLFWIRERAH